MSERTPAESVSIETLLEHRDWVRALARHLVADPNRADDLEQEAWRMAIERPPRHAGSLRAWFGTVVRNAARMSARTQKRRLRLDASARPSRDLPAPDHVTAQAELHAKLVRAVVALGEPYSTAVLYRYFHGLTPTEIAACLHVPVGTVKAQLKRALRRLRERFQEEVDDDQGAWALLLIADRQKSPDTDPPGSPWEQPEALQ